MTLTVDLAEGIPEDVDPPPERVRRDDGAGWSMAAPGLVLLAIFVAIPFVLSIWLSLHNVRLGSGRAPNWMGLEQYRRILLDPDFRGVTGEPAQIDALARGLGVAILVGAPDQDGNYAVDHSAAVFLVDPQARVSALFSGPHDSAVIARDYRRIVAAEG